MNKRKFLSTLVMSVCILAGVTAALAQGRYANVYSRTDVSGFIQNLENSSDSFSRDFQNAGGASASERRIVERFENAVDRLRSNFDRNQTWWNSRNDIQGIMTDARQVNSMMNNERYARRLEQQWRSLRRDINKLADTYELPELAGGGGNWNNNGGGGWNNGGGGGGWNLPGQISAPPAWARGTFYSTSGPRIQMTIDNGGRITLNNEGGVYYGRYNRGRMYLNNDVSTVQRSGNGISTYNSSTGQTTMYSRDGYGGGYNNPGYNNPGYNNPGYNNGGSNDGGPVSSPPNWAVGTFYAEGSDIQMMIQNNGRIVVNNSGQSFVGRFHNGQIYLNNDVSTISRSGRNGLSTYNQSTGQTTVYRRQ